MQKENQKLLSLRNSLFAVLKVNLIEDKQENQNFDIWLLPKGWNFEQFYRGHLLVKLNLTNKELKEKFKEYEYFIKTIFTEKNFKNIASTLKDLNSNISLFNFDDN